MRTIYVFALIFLAASAMAEVNTKRAALITKHIYSLIQTGYTVDTVVQLLNALLTVSQSNLDELEENWDVTRAALLDNIANIQALDDAQHQHCADIEATIEDLQTEVKRYVSYIHDAQDTLESNNENLASRLDARCSGNLLYVGHLKSNQDALRLLHFLRDQVANPGFRDYLESSDSAFVELHRHLKEKKRSTLSVLAKHHMLAMITQAYVGEDSLGYDLSARSDSEIGSGHVDNDQSALSVDSFTIDARNLEDFISELLGFVDSLIEQIEEDNRELQAAEFAAVEDLIEYQDQVEADAVVLNRYITLWVQHIEDLQATIEQDEDALDECEVRAEELDEALEAAEEDFDERTAAFEERQSSLQHTVDALQEIIDVYVNTVANAAVEYKARFDHEMDEMAAERARHQAELEEEERAEVEAQEAADRAAAIASAAATESESTGPISSWISNQEVLEAEEAVAAAAASTETESTESVSVEETESSSTASESLITLPESSPTFATFSAPTTEWAPIETYSESTESETAEETWSASAVSWSAAPATETFTEASVSAPAVSAWTAPTLVSESTETESEATPVWTPESEESSTASETFEPSTWTYVSVSQESTETVSETAAWSAAVSAAQSSVEESVETSESVSALFADAVAAASVSEPTEAVWGAAAASSSSSSTAAEGNGWEWNAETTEESSSSTEALLIQRRGNLRRRF